MHMGFVLRLFILQLLSCVISHRQQCVNRQHFQTRAKGQALRHRTRRAQTGEGTWPAAKHHGL